MFFVAAPRAVSKMQPLFSLVLVCVFLMFCKTPWNFQGVFAAAPGAGRRPGPEEARLRAHLQGGAGLVLREIRLSKLRGVPLGLGEADLVRHGGAVRPRPLTSSRRRATIPVKPQPGNARRHESGEQLCISTIWIPLRK